MALVGLLMVRKPSDGSAGSRPVEFWEVRFREIHEAIKDNHDTLNEIKWILVSRTREFTAIENNLKEQGKALGDVANALQDLLRRRVPR